MSSGLTKKLSGLSASFVRIDGSSTIPSMMISETWTLRWPEGTGEGFGQTALSRLGRSKCRRLGAASARSGRADEDNVPGGAPLHRRDDAARGGEGANVLVRHAASKSSKVTSSAEPQTPLPAL